MLQEDEGGFVRCSLLREDIRSAPKEDLTASYSSESAMKVKHRVDWVFALPLLCKG